MRLPEHLDYDEDSEEDDDGKTDWFPRVRCTIAGCTWNRPAEWDEMAYDDTDTDWNAEHPAHEPAS